MSSELPTGNVTFLFTDIEGSTRLLQELGDRYRSAQDDHARIMRRAIAESSGVEIRTEGDSFFVVFPSAAEALRAAVTVQRELAAAVRPGEVTLRVRMGLHTGEGVLGGDDYLGIDVNKAARIAAAAHGGQILISTATRALVESALPDGVGLRDLGEHRLKDLVHPERLSDLVIDGVASEFPPPRTLEVPTNLPAELTSFVGREAEIRSVRELLGRVRLLTLTGPGGAGKTRLALRAAAELRERFPDGVFLVELAAIDDPSIVPAAIASALGLQQEGLFPRPLMEIVRTNLRERELLLVLDNFEHVLDAAPVIAELLGAAPRLRVLVTSRSVLHLSGEHDLPVPPLSLTAGPGDARVSRSEAAGLFAQRAAAVDPSFELTDDNAAAVTEVCARLDGLPLAIELAASRISVLTPEAMLERFERSLPIMPEGPRDLPARQRTLRGAITWSYDLLPGMLQRFFRDLSSFSGGWTVEAAEAVCHADSPDVDTLDGLSSLVDSSLIRNRTKGRRIRFDMLTTIREHGLERLDSEGDASSVRSRHAACFLAIAEEAEPHLRELEEDGWLDALELEHDNLRAALRWAMDRDEGALGMRLVAALWRFWQLRGISPRGVDGRTRSWRSPPQPDGPLSGRRPWELREASRTGSSILPPFDPPTRSRWRSGRSSATCGGSRMPPST